MSINIPMNEVEKVVYKSTELNELNIAGCKWRRPYKLTFDYGSQININTIQDFSVIPYNNPDIVNKKLTGTAEFDWQTVHDYYADVVEIPVNYNDIVDICGNGKPGYYGPDIKIVDASGNHLASGDGQGLLFTIDERIDGGEVIMTGGDPMPYKLTITVGAGVERYDVNRSQVGIGGGTTGSLRNGSTIYYGDVLSGECECYLGYRLPNGDTRMIIGPTTVKGNTTVNLATTRLKFSKPVIESSEFVTGGGQFVGMAHAITMVIRNNNAFTLKIDGYGVNSAGETIAEITAPNEVGPSETAAIMFFTNETSLETRVWFTVGNGTTDEGQFYADSDIQTTSFGGFGEKISGSPGKSQTITLRSGAEIVVGAGTDSAGDDWYWYNISSNLDIHCVCRAQHWGYHQVPLQYGGGYTNAPIYIYEFDGYSSSEMLDANGNSAYEARIVEDYGTYLGAIQLIDGYWSII